MTARGETRKRIVLFGESLTVASVGASLGTYEQLEVMTLDPHDPAAAEAVQALAPAAVIYDLATTPPVFTLRLLRDRPELLLLGVEPSSNEVTVFSGHTKRGLSTQDLVHLINAKPGTIHSGLRVPVLPGLRHLLSAWPVVMSSRQRKLAFAVAAISVFVVLGMTLSLPGSVVTAPLFGTAVSTGGGLPIVEFGTGIVLAGGCIAWWLHQRTNKKKSPLIKERGYDHRERH